MTIVRRRLNTHKSMRLFIVDKLKEFEKDDITEDKFRTYCYAIKIIADLLKNDNDKEIEKLIDDRDKLLKFKDVG